MNLKTIDMGMQPPYTALLYCAPGVGKSTAIGIIAEASEGNTLVLDVDRTIQRTLAKGEVVKSTSKLLVTEVDNRSRQEKNGTVVAEGTFAAWTNLLKEITPEFLKEKNITTVAVDNISELERCILSDLGAQGKNKGVPAQADYQYMQFKLVNSLRYMKSWGINIVWTAWEDIRNIVSPDGSSFSQSIPKMSLKIIDNICGLCDVVGKILVVKDKDSDKTKHGIILEATQNIYAKNQIDTRKGCLVSEFVPFGVTKKTTKKEEK